VLPSWPAQLNPLSYPPTLQLSRLIPVVLTPAGLEELRINHSSIARLPYCLRFASALRRLDLSNNRQLLLGRADVNLLLACLPCLERLDLRKTAGVWPEALVHLSRAAPQLELLMDSDTDPVS
jgi:hypothetical protein